MLLGYLSATGRPASLALCLTLKPRLAPPPAHAGAGEAGGCDEAVSGEQGDVTRHARKWAAGVAALPACGARVVRALAVDPDGMATLLPRYVAPTPLPPHLAAAAAATTQQDGGGLIAADCAASRAELLMLLAAHWVAHVPHMERASLGRLHGRAWAGSADVLALGAGGVEEHAHLLAGFFLELGQQAFVVLGTSLRGAAAAFVLTTGQGLGAVGAGARAPGEAAAAASSADGQPDGAAPAPAGAGGAPPPAAHQQLRQRLQALQRAAIGAAAAPPAPPMPPAAASAASALPAPLNVSHLRLWDPMTGHCVPVRDPSCELRAVGTVYSASNVWANTQDSGHPWDISWQLEDGGAWRPLFGAALAPRELASIQVRGARRWQGRAGLTAQQ